MRINPKETDNIEISNTEVEDIKDFTYLGSIVSTSRGTDEDIKPKKKEGEASFCHFKTSVEKQGIKKKQQIHVI